MNRLQFITLEATNTLARDVPKNLDVYRGGATGGLIREIDCCPSRIEIAERPALEDLAVDKLDAIAAQRIFQWLGHLTPVQAADERLWTLLTHWHFASYVHKRWGGRLISATKPEDVVLDRWFFRGGGGARIVRNGISRLWWFAYLTYDDKLANPFEFTDILLSLQDIQVAFLERSLGRCRPLLRAVLEAIKKHAEALRNAPRRGDIVQEWAKEIGLYGGVYVLDAIPPERLGFVVENKLGVKLRQSTT